MSGFIVVIFPFDFGLLNLTKERKTCITCNNIIAVYLIAVHDVKTSVMNIVLKQTQDDGHFAMFWAVFHGL